MGTMMKREKRGEGLKKPAKMFPRYKEGLNNGDLPALRGKREEGALRVFSEGTSENWGETTPEGRGHHELGINPREQSEKGREGNANCPRRTASVDNHLHKDKGVNLPLNWRPLRGPLSHCSRGNQP